MLTSLISFIFKDSGGFQLVSLNKFTQITEEGALFESPFDGKPTMLTVSSVTLLTPFTFAYTNALQPEESIAIQHAIGADIIMQLDDVGKILLALLHSVSQAAHLSPSLQCIL